MFRECSSGENIALLTENENYGPPDYDTYDLDMQNPISKTCKILVHRRNANNLWEFLPNVKVMFRDSMFLVS